MSIHDTPVDFSSVIQLKVDSLEVLYPVCRQPTR